MGIQVCPMPTAVLSTHTGGFDGFEFIDLTEHLTAYMNHWRSLNLRFDSIYSGFLGSEKQIAIVQAFIHDFKAENQLVVVDPVMGDDGKLYQTITSEMVDGMKALVSDADMITPNITEAAYLLDREIPEDISDSDIREWLRALSAMGPQYTVITSVPNVEKGKRTATVAYNARDERFWKVSCDYIPALYPGTGDMYTSVLLGSLIQGDSLPIALDRAQHFVSLAIRATFGFEIPHREGVLLERVLDSLKAPVTSTSYELM
jgi:pyridoxine kinase